VAFLALTESPGLQVPSLLCSPNLPCRIIYNSLIQVPLPQVSSFKMPRTALYSTLDMSLVVDNTDVIFAVDRIPDSRHTCFPTYPKIDGFVGLKRVKHRRKWTDILHNQCRSPGNPFRFSVVAMTIAAFNQSLSTLPLGTKKIYRSR
jgi:hypothetical protein